MKPLRYESDRSGDPIIVIALSREPGNTGWTVFTRVSIETYTEDLDNNQSQSNKLDDVADDTVTRIGAENRANHDSDNIAHIINNREWNEERNAN